MLIARGGIRHQRNAHGLRSVGGVDDPTSHFQAHGLRPVGRKAQTTSLTSNFRSHGTQPVGLEGGPNDFAAGRAPTTGGDSWRRLT